VASAQALAREAAARVARAEADVAAAKAKQAVAEAEVGRTAEMLKYTQVRAPFAGVVTARHVHTGHFLTPNTGKTDALFTVARLDPVRVFAEVPEGSAGVAAVGAAVVVTVPALKNRDFPGTVTRTARVLNGESRTLKVEVDLPNTDGALRPGQYVTMKIAATTTQALTVPAAAVLFADETAYCYLVEDGKAVKTRVRVGRAQAGVVEVLARRRAGLTSGGWTPWTGGERVVDGKLGELADGQPVTVK
jgi:RND family efflux transporter MFP subunit